MYKLFFVVLATAGLAGFQSSAQPIDFNQAEIKLAAECRLIWKQKTDSARLAANQQFMNQYLDVLKDSAAFYYPFDSLSQISRLKPEDGSFRITTWNIPLQDGTYKYFGTLEWIDERGQHKVRTIENRIPSDETPPDKPLTADHWYGALYYQLISRKWNGTNNYILLGWNGNDKMSNIKVIDMISFERGEALFGSAVFKTRDGIHNRVIIEYGKKANFLLKYDFQTVLLARGKRVKPKQEWMIVMDRLVPIDPSFAGDYKYYVPSGDTYDAFIFRNGFWVLAEDVMANNRSAPKGTVRPTVPYKK